MHANLYPRTETYLCMFTHITVYVLAHITVYVLAQVHAKSLCADAYIMCACVYAHEGLVILYMCHVALDYVLSHIHVCTVCLVVLSALHDCTVCAREVSVT